MAEGLARAGYRVVVVEQTETPEALKARNEERRRNNQKLCNVVNREKVAVLSKVCGGLREGGGLKCAMWSTTRRWRC